MRNIKLTCFKRLSIFIMCSIISMLSLNLQISAKTVSIDDIYISEKNYSENMNNKAVPFLKEIERDGFISGSDKLNLYYRKYIVDDAKGNIVISHGYTEYIEKYEELIYYFTKEKYNVFIMEHRGNGRSGNLGKEDSTQMYVEDFDYYVDDMKKFVDEIVMPNSENKKIFLFAHSMGGAIGTALLERYPDLFDCAVLSAPMLEIDTGSTPSFLAKILTNIKNIIGNDGEYVLGHGSFIKSNSVDGSGTTSKGRFEYANNILNEEKQLQRGGASYKWLYESFNAVSEITKKSNIKKIEVPVLLFQAENDTYVKPGGQDKLNKYCKNCELVFVQNSKHEIYREKDEIQKPYIKAVMNFFEKNCEK